MNNQAIKPATLDELEQLYLTGEGRARRRRITIREVETVRQLQDDRFRRRIGYVLAATLVGLVAVAIVSPGRADVVKGLLESILVAISSYLFGRYSSKKRPT